MKLGVRFMLTYVELEHASWVQGKLAEKVGINGLNIAMWDANYLGRENIGQADQPQHSW